MLKFLQCESTSRSCRQIVVRFVRQSDFVACHHSLGWVPSCFIHIDIRSCLGRSGVSRFNTSCDSSPPRFWPRVLPLELPDGVSPALSAELVFALMNVSIALSKSCIHIEAIDVSKVSQEFKRLLQIPLNMCSNLIPSLLGPATNPSSSILPSKFYAFASPS